ncbi:galactose-specific lectin nattectin [Carassius auratus]|uniref:Galactose-specific lectin nattectin n=1 Tax=Carassius auratus TaxID=7957 RepID=A0A6P6N554_CARAU|nr:galactose-specific lectin nattectin-like [Carassius auratus]XP_052429974.1 galactose-specific lectin nattectin [Carassius gibelio]
MGVWIVCVSLCLLFALNASASSRCQYGWTRYGRTCFKVFNSPLSWSDAEAMCLTYGGNLASVHSTLEYTFIKRMISSSNSYWIGGSDAVSEGKWFWSDGSQMDFKLWNPKEPNNLQSNEHCIQMNFGAAGNWNDQVCSNKLPFVCFNSH